MVQSQIEEQRLAGDGLELRRERHQTGLFPDQGGVQTEGVQAVAQRLQEAEKAE